MLLRLFLLLTIVPLVELTLLLTLARYTGVWATLALVVGTAIAGALLLRWQGGQVIQTAQREVAAGRMPTAMLIDGAMVFVAAMFLITPGVLTDACGILLLIPWSRRIVRWFVVRWIQANFKVTMLSTGRPGGFADGDTEPRRPPNDDNVIDGQATPLR